MKKEMTKTEKTGSLDGGYIAIVSAVMVTLVLLLVVLVSSERSFLGNENARTLEAKEESAAAAEGCLEHALLKIAIGSYSGNETIAVGSSTCAVLPVQFLATGTVIKASSTVRNVTTKLRLIVATSSLQTISKEEVASW